MQIEEKSKEQELETAKILEDNASHPIYLLYQRIFKETLEGHYFTLSHLNPTDSIEKKLQCIERISGRIAELETLLEIPRNYAEFVKGIEEEEKKLDKK